jgi:hypothetical protein
MAGELLDLVTGQDVKLKKRVIARVCAAIAGSFEQDKSSITQSETRRRFQIVERLMRDLRSLGWPFERICDELPTALRCKLDGAPWEPSARNSWGGS